MLGTLERFCCTISISLYISVGETLNITNLKNYVMKSVKDSVDYDVNTEFDG